MEKKRENWLRRREKWWIRSERTGVEEQQASLLKSLSAGAGGACSKNKLRLSPCLYLQFPCLDLGKGVLGAAFRKQLNTPSVPDE
ncbi:unnamed protein product [Bursaphelenchus okinawaensis]|uniref:Uncharacterized protein n=1 Tax=Bursaphelenchus okinawaensis TaxID=465554 RepID=A0A811JX11_9BILA|nr:unnamed protein product [Bursaphelenchus okinawaensis]CAG9086352.1 unnamed protein product [Bursaphelenchus okinawaensis]